MNFNILNDIKLHWVSLKHQHHAGFNSGTSSSRATFMVVTVQVNLLDLACGCREQPLRITDY